MHLAPNLRGKITDHSTYTDALQQPDPRLYPKDLDITSLIREPSHDHSPHKREKPESHRPWPKTREPSKPSKREQETYTSPATKPPTTNAASFGLRRWKDEPAIQGLYHGINEVVKEEY